MLPLIVHIYESAHLFLSKKMNSSLSPFVQNLLLRYFNCFSVRTGTRRREGLRISGYVWISHGIFHTWIQNPRFVLKDEVHFRRKY
ncbi:hypothetical protein PUN28_018814 [Cardiocondyla obscurior]|uniref:Uncharacterized protein n=1 Tax=Cardiocondyla obscurior TaxID=286306 RepID=A0AAW2EC72_9HYME